MLLSGFTFIRNAIKFDFPIRECVESMLPIVDELVINVGRSEDGTEDVIEEIRSEHPAKIKLVNSVWDDSKTKDGLVLSEQTNIALDACKGRWALYLQSDEALHEAELPFIRKSVETADAIEEKPEAFRFRYLHFYGGYTLIQRPWNWYPSDIRIVRTDVGARSFGDAQTFKGHGNRDLKARLLDAHIFHYGHARAPEKMLTKIHYFHRFWHGDQHGKKTSAAYRLKWKDLVWYWGTHPKVYDRRVKEGKAWSPKPSDFADAHWSTVVVAYSPKNPEQTALAQLLKERLQREKVNVVLTSTVGGWLRFVYTKWIARHRNALIDLNAAGRGLVPFLFRACGSWTAFSHRIAHVPSGRLSSLRQRFFHAVHWATHEDDAGFKVPRQLWANQLLNWLGFLNSFGKITESPILEKTIDKENT